MEWGQGNQQSSWQPSLLPSTQVMRLENELKDLLTRFERDHDITPVQMKLRIENNIRDAKKEALQTAFNTINLQAQLPGHAIGEPRLNKRTRDEYERGAAGGNSIAYQIEQALRNPRLISEIKRMKSEQVNSEKVNSSKRISYLADQEKRRSDMFKMHEERLKTARNANEFNNFRQRNEIEFANLEATFREELLRRDESLIQDLNVSAKSQQVALARLGVPGFSVTDDPQEINSQKEILRIISDEIDRMENKADAEIPNSLLSRTLLTELQRKPEPADSPENDQEDDIYSSFKKKHVRFRKDPPKPEVASEVVAPLASKYPSPATSMSFHMNQTPVPFTERTHSFPEVAPPQSAPAPSTLLPQQHHFLNNSQLPPPQQTHFELPSGVDLLQLNSFLNSLDPMGLLANPALLQEATSLLTNSSQQPIASPSTFQPTLAMPPPFQSQAISTQLPQQATRSTSTAMNPFDMGFTQRPSPHPNLLPGQYLPNSRSASFPQSFPLGTDTRLALAPVIPPSLPHLPQTHSYMSPPSDVVSSPFVNTPLFQHQDLGPSNDRLSSLPTAQLDRAPNIFPYQAGGSDYAQPQFKPQR